MLLRSLRVAPALLIALLTASGCGAWAETPDTSRARSLLPASASSELEAQSPTSSETHCPKASAQTPQVGDSEWLKTQSGAAISGIARDATQRVWLTQSGTQTALLSPEGDVLWSRPFGSLVALREGQTAAPTADAAAYVAGSFSGTLALGPLSLTSQGQRDVYVARLSDAGDVLAAFALGGAEDDDITSLAVDGAGELVVSGPGIGTQKLSPSGAALWRRSFWGKAALDAADAVLLTAALRGEQDFGGGALSSRGGADVVVVKLSSAGEHIYSRSFGDAGEQQGEALAVDEEGNALVAGTFDGALDFGAGAQEKPADACASDASCATFGFLAKLDAQGSALWSVSLGPMKELTSATAVADRVVVSGALPGGVRPFRHPWLGGFDADGAQRFERTEWPATGVGGGAALSSAACGSVIWGVSARPSFDEEEQSYVASIRL